MNPDEALAAVKRAVELLPDLTAAQNPHGPLLGEIITEEGLWTLIIALRAIASGGPLVCVPREPTKKMLEVGNDAAQLFGKLPSVYRAMIAEGEKP